MNIPRHSLYGESQEISKKVSRPSSALSNNENNMFDFVKSIGGHRTSEFDSRVTTISPIEIPTSYDAFESGLPKSNSMTSMFRSGMSMSSHTTSNNPTPAPSQTTVRWNKVFRLVRHRWFSFRTKQFWRKFFKNVLCSFNKLPNWINNTKWLRKNWHISKPTHWNNAQIETILISAILFYRQLFISRIQFSFSFLRV